MYVCLCVSCERRMYSIHNCEKKLGKDIDEAFGIIKVNQIENLTRLVYKERLVKMSICKKIKID